MAYSNIDQAVTIPQNQVYNGLVPQLLAQNRRNQELRLREQEDERRRSESLLKTLGDQASNKHYMTMTAYDPIVNNQLAGVRLDIAKMIQNKASDVDVNMELTRRLGDLSSFTEGVKSIKANIDQQVKAYSKYQGIDSNALQQVAMSNAIYKTDPKTGQKVLRSPNELDPNQDYIAETIRNNPELILKGDQGIRKFNESFKPVNMSQLPIKTEDNGVTVTKQYDAYVPAYMELQTDGKGWGTGIKVRSKTIPDIKGADGKPLEVADDEVYNSYNSDPASAAYLNKALKDFNQSSKAQIDPSSPEADIWKSHYLLDWLNRNKTGRFSNGGGSVESALKEKADRGLPLSSYRAGLSDAAKLLKAEEKAGAYDSGIVARAMAGDPEMLQGAKIKEVNGKKYYDVLDLVGRMKINIDAAGEAEYAKGLLVNPGTGELILEKNGKTANESVYENYEGSGARRFMVSKASINGSTPDKAIAGMNVTMDKQGKFIKKYDRSNLADLEAQQELNQLTIKKERNSQISAFSASGDIKKLETLTGATLKNGTKIKELGARNQAQRIVMDPFYIILKDGTKKTFETAGQLSAYLENNLK